LNSDEKKIVGVLPYIHSSLSVNFVLKLSQRT